MNTGLFSCKNLKKQKTKEKHFHVKSGAPVKLGPALTEWSKGISDKTNGELLPQDVRKLK